VKDAELAPALLVSVERQGLWAIVPTIAVSLLFWFVMRAIIRADRTERAAQAKYEAEIDARIAAERAAAPHDPAR